MKQVETFFFFHFWQGTLLSLGSVCIYIKDVDKQMSALESQGKGNQTTCLPVKLKISHADHLFSQCLVQSSTSAGDRCADCTTSLNSFLTLGVSGGP